VLVAAGFSSVYGVACYKGIDAKNEAIRMGIAGSLSNVIIESSFHFVDTVNVRAKVSEKNISSMKMVQKIYAKEGLFGFGKGFSACFYGSIFCGFIYFSLYKIFKQVFREMFGDRYNIAWSYFAASFVAELFTLLVYYPYDLVKCRLQSKNYEFKYQNIPHAFKKEISDAKSIMPLYRGALPFLMTYCIFISIQFTIYEYIMRHFKEVVYRGDSKKFEDNKFNVNLFAACLAGAVGSGVTNSLDVITINKQANPKLNITKMI
jgi:hypothetical protein